ncbi:MAG TPA: CHASE2 domain-containing protein, partial [Rhodocyclaceae bacterium]|nr:CHASE2 domain-containing protein [Rhodocyclaceae bacterium]
MKASFWKTDWFLGTAVSIVMLALGGSSLIQSLERKAYDLGAVATNRTPSDRIAVIAIDKTSLDNIGRWPWSREIHARMIDSLSKAQAKVIASTVFFSEPQIDPGLAYINRLIAAYNQRPADAGMPAGFGELLAEAERALNTDRQLAESIARANNVALPYLFRLG